MQSLRASNRCRIIPRSFATSLNCQRRTFKAAVVGGGITGLTAAWKLSADPSCAGVTIYEQSPRLGGWLSSDSIDVDGGHILFENGPRTLRSDGNSLATWWLALKLGLQDDLLVTHKEAPAATNRFLYYPDHLVRVPTPRPGVSAFTNIMDGLKTVMKEPVFETLATALLFESVKPPRSADQWAEDESIADFISRRFSPEIADNLISAIMHGIYAGDIDKLSAQALLGPLRNMEDTGILKTMITNALTRTKTGTMDTGLCLHSVMDDRMNYPGLKNPNIWNAVYSYQNQAATFSFKGGIQQLTDALTASLKESNKVRIFTGTPVQNMRRLNNSDEILIAANGKPTQSYDRVIASLPTPALARMLKSETNHPKQSPPPRETIKMLEQHNYATTVMVVNLFYPDLDPENYNAFGYLIPRSIPYEQNPECALGVQFASSTSTGLAVSDHLFTEPARQDSVGGTKFTVMLGGHYWDDWKDTDYPDHETAVKMSRSLLERHLHITKAPSVTTSRLQKNAIPQYTVGHTRRMYELSETVKNDFNRRLILAGNWYNGVGVNDCIKQGFLAASFGTGSRTLQQDTRLRGPWRDYSFWEWDLEGGIPTAPVKFF